MVSDNTKYPKCFGILEKVFPKTENGFRETPESCLLSCQLKTECLRFAMTKGPEANKAQEERVDRSYQAGMISFFERWARKKHLKKHKKSKGNGVKNEND